MLIVKENDDFLLQVMTQQTSKQHDYFNYLSPCLHLIY